MYCRIVDLCNIHQVASVAMVAILPQASLLLHMLRLHWLGFSVTQGQGIGQGRR